MHFYQLKPTKASAQGNCSTKAGARFTQHTKDKTRRLLFINFSVRALPQHQYPPRIAFLSSCLDIVSGCSSAGPDPHAGGAARTAAWLGPRAGGQGAGGSRAAAASAAVLHDGPGGRRPRVCVATGGVAAAASGQRGLCTLPTSSTYGQSTSMHASVIVSKSLVGHAVQSPVQCLRLWLYYWFLVCVYAQVWV